MVHRYMVRYVWHAVNFQIHEVNNFDQLKLAVEKSLLCLIQSPM